MNAPKPDTSLQAKQSPIAAIPLREDILISLCVTDIRDPGTEAVPVREAARHLAARFRYWELVLIAESGREGDFEGLLSQLPNARLISVVSGLDIAQRRLVAAGESIGDVIMLASIEELGRVEPCQMIEEAQDDSVVVIGQRTRPATGEAVAAALGRISGFIVSTRDMQTAAYPRSVLSRLMRDANPVLALRFPPRDNTVRIRYHPAAEGQAFWNRMRGEQIGNRMDMLLRLVTDAAPVMLGLIAACSALMFVVSMLFALYTLVVYLVKADVVEGWTTLALALSGSIGFTSFILFGISIALRKLLEILRSSTVDYVVGERSSVDLFETIADQLNVDTDAPGARPVEDPGQGRRAQ